MYHFFPFPLSSFPFTFEWSGVGFGLPFWNRCDSAPSMLDSGFVTDDPCACCLDEPDFSDAGSDLGSDADLEFDFEDEGSEDFDDLSLRLGSEVLSSSALEAPVPEDLRYCFRFSKLELPVP